MSGGYFDYTQYNIDRIADEIENIVKNDNRPDEDGYTRHYADSTLRKLLEGVQALRVASVYAQRIDWLLSGDDGENTFHERLKEDLYEISGKKAD